MTPENNQNLGTKINHSGNLGLEKPVREFDKTPLEVAEQKHFSRDESGELIIDPAHINAETSDDIGYTPRTETVSAPEKKGFTKKQKIIAALSGVALLAGIGGGIAASNMNGPDKSPVAEAPADPGEAPADPTTPTETEAPVAPPEQFEFNVDSQVIESYLAESQEIFMARPIEERLLVALAYAEDMPKFAEDWYSVSQNKLDILPATISVENTPQEIVTIAGYMHRMPYTVSTESDDYHLDMNAAYKIIGGNHIQGTSSSAYSSFTSFADQFTESLDGRKMTARTLAVSDYLPALTVINSSELQNDQQGRPYRVISLPNLEGQDTDYTFRWVTAANGVGMWVQD